MMELSCEQATDLAGGFVLDALEPAEMETVRQHLAGCAKPHREFEELGGVVPYLYAALDPIEPSPSVRERIRGVVRPERLGPLIGSDAAAAPVPADSSAAGEAAPRGDGQPVGAWRRTRIGIAFAVGLATIVVLATSTLYLASQLADSRAYADQVARAVALAAVPGSRTIILAPAGGGPVAPRGASGIAVLPASGTGTVVARGLTETQGTEVYEVWVIEGSAAPAPAGSFTVGSDGRGWVDRLAVAVSGSAPVAVALTKEPGPGASTPTLPIVVSGQSQSS